MTERQDSASPTLSQRMRQFEINKANRLSANSTTGSTVEDFEDFHPRERIPLLTRYPPPKTTIAAILLTIGGIVFLSLGLSVLYAHWLTHGKDRAITLIVLGSIMLLPGSYASFVIFASWRRWPGYDYSMLPSYDDD